ncbi:MAG: adenylate/guanylate cyclase domain-containing protein [bacterium]
MTKELEERDRVRDLLGKVVSPEIAEELLNKKLELGGEEREVTILFTAVRNFTTLSENYPQRAVLEMLNTHLTRMRTVVEKNGGVVDKYIGDSVMAIFGAPLHHDDADRRLKTAIEMMQMEKEINEDFKRKGLTAIEIGIGINTAVVIAGNMGSQSRMNYTVIGDGVNVASRLENLTRVTQCLKINL